MPVPLNVEYIAMLLYMLAKTDNPMYAVALQAELGG